MNVTYTANRLTQVWKGVVPDVSPDEPPIINHANQRPMTMMMLPCKPIPGLTKVVRRPPLQDTMGMRPSTGIARDQTKGLAYDADIPIDTPVLPPAHNYMPVGYTNLL